MPARIGYSQHEGAEACRLGRRRLEKVVDGTHPVVYPAAGSHANFYGSALLLGASGSQGVGCDDTTGPSVELRPPCHTIPSDPAEARVAFPWIEFEGRWGELQPAFYNGPTGPNLKTQWTQPIEWSQGWRGTSYAVPAGGALGTECHRLLLRRHRQRLARARSGRRRSRCGARPCSARWWRSWSSAAGARDLDARRAAAPRTTPQPGARCSPPAAASYARMAGARHRDRRPCWSRCRCWSRCCRRSSCTLSSVVGVETGVRERGLPGADRAALGTTLTLLGARHRAGGDGAGAARARRRARRSGRCRPTAWRPAPGAAAARRAAGDRCVVVVVAARELAVPRSRSRSG